VSQRRSGPCGLFSIAEDKVKLSHDVIEKTFTSTATVCRDFIQRKAVYRFVANRLIPRANDLDCRRASRRGKRFVVRADEKLTAFLELECHTRINRLASLR
jgi:hypothetical protein